MSSVRYTALDTRADHDHRDDMEAAFDYSEDEDDENLSESRPLNPYSASPSNIQSSPPPSHVPGTYDFENIDYDYPPPGSPPRPSAVALPNNYGNSNGFIPSVMVESRQGSRRSWFQQSASTILPVRFAQRIGLVSGRPIGAVGGGTNNDGVFANVTAKPTLPMTIQEGDETYVVPENTRADAPPSYASAQADAVPPYWETTVHAPFTPGSAGEILVDSLPTGSLFSFLWNMLISISFQFVGFLLTHLLHATHAARLGSRAGLGVTLIQYGFSLRGRMDTPRNGSDGTGPWPASGASPPLPTSSGGGYGSNSISGNSTFIPYGAFEQQADLQTTDATTEWLSFFLMTVGWFILLTSLLGFWRVKRWERSILASQRDNSNPQAETPSPFTVLSQMERSFGLRGTSRADLFRQGFGFETRHEEDNILRHAEEGRHNPDRVRETDAMIPIGTNDPEQARSIEEALTTERLLRDRLRGEGFL